MFCIACGTRLPDDAAYCSQCGRATHRPEADQSRPAQPPAGATGATAPGAGAHPSAARRWSEAAGVPFFYEERWWSRGPSGEVVVWNAARDDWETALAAQTPFFMRRPRFVSLRTPAIWLYVLLVFFIITTVLAVAADLEVAHLANRVENGEEVAVSSIEDADGTLNGMKGLQAITLLSAASVFIWWTFRATRNLPALGARSLQFTPGWAIAWWLIPIANWVQPARVLSQAWKASDPALPPEQNEDWHGRAVDPLLVVWWLTWAAGYIAWNIAFVQWDAGDLDSSARLGWSIALACADGVLGVAAALAIVFVRRLSVRQERANARFDVPAPTAAPSATGTAAAPSW